MCKTWCTHDLSTWVVLCDTHVFSVFTYVSTRVCAFVYVCAFVWLYDHANDPDHSGKWMIQCADTNTQAVWPTTFVSSLHLL